MSYGDIRQIYLEKVFLANIYFLHCTFLQNSKPHFSFYLLSYAFSINGRKTIQSLSNYNEVLGQRRGLSKIDIAQLNKYYNCKNTGGGGGGGGGGGTGGGSGKVLQGLYSPHPVPYQLV